METEEESPSKKANQAKRPMNAFLIFCKRHRSLVREKNPHLDNRSVTRILGELWAKLSSDEKASYTSLANEYKEAFMKANPDYKWFNTDKSNPVREGKPSTRPTNSLVAYHGEVPRSESHETNTHTGHYQQLTPTTSSYSSVIKTQHSEGSRPVTLSSTSVPKTPQAHTAGTIDLSKKVTPNSSVDQQQVSMVMELMKCVSDANSYSGLPEQKISTVTVATSHNNSVSKGSKGITSADYGNLSLLHLAKMCSNELENTKKDGKTDVQTTMLTPPWTPQYDQTYSPPKVEDPGAPLPPIKEYTDKENQPSNMQNNNSPHTESDTKMTLSAFKQKQYGTPGGVEHFKNLILSTENDVTTCGKLVVDRVIESIYSQEFGNAEKNLAKQDVIKAPKTSVVSSTYTPHQVQQSHIDIKVNDKSSAPDSNQMRQKKLPNNQSAAVKNEALSKGKDKMSLTFGQIQETLIRRAVENAYEFDIASGLKSENKLYLHGIKDSSKIDAKGDFSVFDFASSEGNQSPAEETGFSSRIKGKKFDWCRPGHGQNSTRGAALTSANQDSVPHTQTSVDFSNKFNQASRVSGSEVTTSSATGARTVLLPTSVGSSDGQHYPNKTAMELLQKCDEMYKSVHYETPINRTPSHNTKTSQYKTGLHQVPTVNTVTSTDKVTAVKESPPVPPKKRKFHMPVDFNVVEEKPSPPPVKKGRERNTSVDVANLDENSRDSTDSNDTRKSKRSNRGQRYKALMKEGVLQGSREKSRKNSNCSETSTPSNDDSPTPTPVLPPPPTVGHVTVSAANNDHVIVPRPIRKRTYSDVASFEPPPSRTRRYTTGDFDLDAHIASLPIVDIDGVSKKGIPRPKAKPKIRHHSESSILATKNVPQNTTASCQQTTLSVTSWCANASAADHNSTTEDQKLLNVAELRQVIRERTNSGGSDLGRERSNSGSSQLGSAKRKARKAAITHLIPVSQQAVNVKSTPCESKESEKLVSVASRNAAHASTTTTSTDNHCLPTPASMRNAKEANRLALTCP